MSPVAGSGMEGEHPSREDVTGTACSVQLQQFLWGLFLAKDGLGGGDNFSLTVITKNSPSVHLLPLSYIALPLGLVQKKILEGSQEEMMSKHSSKDSVFLNFLVYVSAFSGK